MPGIYDVRINNLLSQEIEGVGYWDVKFGQAPGEEGVELLPLSLKPVEAHVFLNVPTELVTPQVWNLVETGRLRLKANGKNVRHRDDWPESKPVPLPLDMPNSSSIVCAVATVRLAEAFTGPLIRVRRDSDQSEQDIPQVKLPNGLWVVDMAEVAAFCGASPGHAVEWYDQSGNGRDITQDAASNQPMIWTGTEGYRPTPSGAPTLYHSNDLRWDNRFGGNWNSWRRGGVAAYVDADSIADRGIMRVSDEKFGLSLDDGGFNGTPGIGFSRGNRKANLYVSPLAVEQQALAAVNYKRDETARFRCTATEDLANLEDTGSVQGSTLQVYQVGGASDLLGRGALGIFWGSASNMLSDEFDAFFASLRIALGV